MSIFLMPHLKIFFVGLITIVGAAGGYAGLTFAARYGVLLPLGDADWADAAFSPLLVAFVCVLIYHLGLLILEW